MVNNISDTAQAALFSSVSTLPHTAYRLVACIQVLEEAQGKVLQVVFSLSLLAHENQESRFQLSHLV